MDIGYEKLRPPASSGGTEPQTVVESLFHRAILPLGSNFRADYKCKDFYAVAQIEWDDILGTFVQNPPCDTECQKPFLFGSGTCDYLCLKRGCTLGV